MNQGYYFEAETMRTMVSTLARTLSSNHLYEDDEEDPCSQLPSDDDIFVDDWPYDKAWWNKICAGMTPTQNYWKEDDLVATSKPLARQVRTLSSNSDDSIMKGNQGGVFDLIADDHAMQTI